MDFFKQADDLFKEVCKTYKKTENEMYEDVDAIKKWLQTQHHLPEIMPESHIRNFLILNKFSIEKTKQKIDMYYTIRSLIPDMFDYCNPKSLRMRHFYNQGDGGVHPHLIQGLYRVYIVKMHSLESEFLPHESILSMCNVGEIRLHEDCVFYDIIIVDVANLKFSDVTKITPTIVLKAAAIYEKVFSFCLKNAYIVNSPSYVSKPLAILKMLLKPKIFDKFRVYEDDQVLKEIFTTDTLPKDYGGHGPSLQELKEFMLNKFDEYQSRFDELDKMRVDENLRPEKLVNDDILGYYGNFKKLSVD